MSNIHDGGSPMTDGNTMGTTAGAGDEALRLDGNAAAGMLAEIFAVEITSAQVTCAHCGRTGSLGSLLMYGGQIGTILRCPTCDAIQLRIARIHEQYWMDLRGMATMRIAPASPA